MKQYLNRLLKKLQVIVMIFGGAGTFAGEAVTISFHDSSTVKDTQIFIKDIADVSTTSKTLRCLVEQTAVGEAAPPGYSRFLNTEDLIRYRLQPNFKEKTFSAKGSIRVTVRTEGVEKKAGDYRNQIQKLLEPFVSWKSDEWTVALENPEASWKCLNAPFEISISGLTTGRPKGHERLLLEVRQMGRTYRIPISCMFHVSAQVAVARRDIMKNSVITADDIVIKKTDITSLGPDPFFSENALTGKKALRNIMTGSIFHERMVLAVPAISKGDQVSIELLKGSVKVSVAAIARENGYQGKKIWVENAANHKLIRAVAKDSHTVSLL